MLDSLPDNYIVNVSDIINLEEAYFVNKFTNAEAAINAVFSIFYILIVFFNTPESMKNFRKIMLFYTFNVMIIDIGAVCLRFSLLMPFKVAFPLGLLGPLNVWQSFMTLYFTAFATMNTFDALTAIFLERHFVIVSIVAPKQMKFRKILYIILISSNLIVVHVTMVVAVVVQPSEKETADLLRKHVMNSDILLNIQDSLLRLPNSGWVIWSVIAVGGAYVSIRVGIALFIIYYSYKLGKTFKNALSKKTQEGLIIMLKSLITQFTVIGCFAMVPIVIGTFCCIFVLAFSQMLLSICICILGLYPTIDFWCSLMIIRPYKVAVIKILTLRRIHPEENANVTPMNNGRAGRKIIVNATE